MSTIVNMVYKTHDNVRMAGFLEKKGKMKLMSQWKKYWFVLEERLLLYYRSEVEYTNLSPCRGSLNMGLVTTVRPGASSGPCIIHVITRTQVVQLRAKNRATQEEWLQALLHSMSLPLVPKTLKPHVTKKNLLGYGLSLDNITCKHKENGENCENEWTFPRKLDYRKRQISGSVYGGSLDTAIWSKKLKPPRTPSPNIPKGKILEKILSFTAENESASALPKNSRCSLNDDKEMKYIGENHETDEFWKERSVRCKVHDENRNHELYSKVQKRKKKVTKTLSDTELNKKSVDIERKEESAFDRLRNVLSRIPRDKILKGRYEPEKRIRPTKKRRQSFLQKVFKKKEESQEFESDVNDPLYDTIDHTEEEPQSSIPVEIVPDNEPDDEEEEKEKPEEGAVNVESMYAEVRKPLVGSKTILPARTLSELRLKLKSRENLDEGVKMSESAPSLPPRRMSRPISPWHDVPTNNAPVGDAKSFFVHQAVVKFNDSIPLIDLPKTDNDFSDIEEELKLDVTTSVEPRDTMKLEKKNDDLSILLDQLTKITVAPLAEPELTDDTYNSSSDSEKFWNKSQFSDPDYDIPRPHRPLSIVISQGREIISSTQFMGACDNNSDTGSSFRSMEPDSLEMTEKKANFS